MRTIFSLFVLLVWSSLQFVYAQTNPPGLHNQSNIDLLETLSSKSTLTPQERTQAIQAMLVIANEARQNPDYRRLQGCTNATTLPSGLSKLVLDDRLINIAQDQSNYQASITTMTHENSNFANYGARMNSYLPGISVPEACGVGGYFSAYPINWMKGKTHYKPTWNLDKDNLPKDIVNSVGFGMAKGVDNRWYVTAVWANIPVPVYTAPSGSTGDFSGFIGKVVSFTSVNFPDRQIMVKDNLGVLDPPPAGSNLNSFKVVPALNGKVGFISLESVTFPGHYLRHESLRIKLHQSNGSQIFKDDASFQPMAPLFPTSGAFSLQSSNYPNWYIRHTGFQLMISESKSNFPPNDRDVFNKDATFVVKIK